MPGSASPLPTQTDSRLPATTSGLVPPSNGAHPHYRRLHMYLKFGTSGLVPPSNGAHPHYRRLRMYLKLGSFLTILTTSGLVPPSNGTHPHYRRLHMYLKFGTSGLVPPSNGSASPYSDRLPTPGSIRICSSPLTTIYPSFPPLSRGSPPPLLVIRAASRRSG